MLAYAGAVPCSCRKNSLLISITLFFNTMLQGFQWGGGGGLGLPLPVGHADIPSLCGILVYSDDTSMLTRMALCGILVDVISLINSPEV